jgi:hypothetical protein
MQARLFGNLVSPSLSLEALPGGSQPPPQDRRLPSSRWLSIVFDRVLCLIRRMGLWAIKQKSRISVQGNPSGRFPFI